MRKLLLLVGFCAFAMCGIAQTISAVGEPKTYEDSLILAKSMIDDLTFSSLESILENYRHLNKVEPSKINHDVLNLLENKYKSMTDLMMFHLELDFPITENMNLQSHADSISYVKSLIDDIGFSKVPYVLERYRYLNQIKPALVNKELLNYLEEKQLNLFNEN